MVTDIDNNYYPWISDLESLAFGPLLADLEGLVHSAIIVDAAALALSVVPGLAK